MILSRRKLRKMIKKVALYGDTVRAVNEDRRYVVVFRGEWVSARGIPWKRMRTIKW